MSGLKLVGGNFDGLCVSDTGERHSFVWNEKDGQKSTAAFFGESMTWVDVYQKRSSDSGIDYYEFIGTI